MQECPNPHTPSRLAHRHSCQATALLATLIYVPTRAAAMRGAHVAVCGANPVPRPAGYTLGPLP